MTADAWALLCSLLSAWLVLWLMVAMLRLYLRPVFAEDDAGSGRYLVR